MPFFLKSGFTKLFLVNFFNMLHPKAEWYLRGKYLKENNYMWELTLTLDNTVCLQKKKLTNPAKYYKMRQIFSLLFLLHPFYDKAQIKICIYLTNTIKNTFYW